MGKNTSNLLYYYYYTIYLLLLLYYICIRAAAHACSKVIRRTAGPEFALCRMLFRCPKTYKSLHSLPLPAIRSSLGEFKSRN